ncbi:PIG-L family deacetylase, partial [candidate division WWE3 bacterium]|nr:PIG-L family deacetylase [candidate division WWE3 bacterium]
MFSTIFGILIIVLSMFWVIAFLKGFDHKVKTIDLPAFKNILVIYPHPDDEVLTVGGLVQLFRDMNANTTFYIATKGENGTPTAEYDESLAERRAAEMRAVGNILNTNTVIVDDFKDGGLNKQVEEIRTRVSQIMSEVVPDLVITYDQSGMYGHEDHIILSKITTDIIKDTFPETTLWYASLPEKMYAAISLPEHMAKDNEFRNKRMRPTHKIWVGSKIMNKVKSVYAHKSQYESFRKSIPIRIIP